MLCLRKMRSAGCLCTVALWLAPAIVHALPQSGPDQAPSPEVTLKSTIRTVVLDVVVTDGNGRPIDGLSKQDFTLLEKGREQKIVSFESVNSSGSKDPAEAVAQDILLLDEMNSQFADAAYARHCLRKLLTRKDGLLRSPTLLLALTDRGLVILHGTTRDSAALLSALDHHQPGLPSRLLLAGSSQEMERVWISLAALQKIAMAYGGSSVRSNLIWISPGFPMFSTFFVNSSTQNSIFDTIRSLSAQLLRARIAVYTVDLRGVPSTAFSPGADVQYASIRPGSGDTTLVPTREAFGEYVQSLSERGSLDFPDLALRRFAQETGGKSFWGRNDLDAEILSSSLDGAHSYTLSYYPSDRDFDGTFRQIAVKVNRQGAQARTRAGYFAMADPPPPTQAEIVDEVERALGNPVPYVGLRVSAVASQATAGSELSVAVDPRGLTWRPLPNGGQECSFTATTASFSQGRVPSLIRSHQFSAQLPPGKAPPLSQTPVVVKLAVPADPGLSHVRVVVRDEATGTMGTADVLAAR